VFKGPVAERSRLMAWAFLLIAVACVVALLFLVARDALRHGRDRGAG